MSKPIDPSPTPQDFSWWGFYCDSCNVFFDIQIDGTAHSSVDGVSYSHKCGNGARYISYAVREDVRRLTNLISSECATAEAAMKESQGEIAGFPNLAAMRQAMVDTAGENASLRAQLAEAIRQRDALQKIMDGARMDMNGSSRETLDHFAELSHAAKGGE